MFQLGIFFVPGMLHGLCVTAGMVNLGLSKDSGPDYGLRLGSAFRLGSPNHFQAGLHTLPSHDDSGTGFPLLSTFLSSISHLSGGPPSGALSKLYLDFGNKSILDTVRCLVLRCA